MNSLVVKSDAELNNSEGCFYDGLTGSGHLKENFDFVKYITRGNYGKIFKVREKSTNSFYALKLLKKNFVETYDSDESDDSEIETGNEMMKREKRIMKNLKIHPFLVYFHSIFDTENHIAIVMEYIDGFPMSKHLSKLNDRCIGEKDAAFYLAEISCAVHFLHENGIMHRDIKLENIMINGDGHIKLIDFGYSKDALGFNDKTSSDMGLLINAAPELFLDIPYSFAVDWYAVGLVLYTILTGNHPFVIFSPGKSTREITNNMISAMYEMEFVFKKDISDNAISMLKRLLEPDPEYRIGSKDSSEYMEISYHVFLADIDWIKIARKEVEPPYVPIPKTETNK